MTDNKNITVKCDRGEGVGGWILALIVLYALNEVLEKLDQIIELLTR